MGRTSRKRYNRESGSKLGMPENMHETQDASTKPDGQDAGKGLGALLRWFLILFFIFLVLGTYAVLQRRSEHAVLAEQTERMAVPYVSVIHATPINSDSEMVLP